MATSRKAPAADAPDRSPFFLVPRGWLVALAVLALIPWIAFGVMLLGSGRTPLLADPAPVSDTKPADPGPWGRLMQTPILISPPIELIADDWGREAGSGKYWFFPQTSAAAAQGFLSSAGLTGAQVADLMRTAQPEPRINGLVMLPDENLLRTMAPDVRARLYAQLSGSSLNVNIAHAFRFAGSTPDDWLPNTLAPSTRAVVDPLIYKHGNHLYLADIDLIFSLVTDPDERRRLGKAVLRQGTVRVRLEVGSTSEVPALVDYWGRGGRRLDIRPLMESVAGSADASIDIVHLLPSLAREHLYRYPRRTALDFDRPALANCLWTALNFFEAEPDNRLLEVDAAIARLKDDYYLVQNTPEFGDVIVMVDEQGNIFHAVNFIADDLVFTKNGVSPLAPWVILPLDEVLDYYSTRSAKPKLIIHRRKDF